MVGASANNSVETRNGIVVLVTGVLLAFFAPASGDKAWWVLPPIVFAGAIGMMLVDPRRPITIGWRCPRLLRSHSAGFSDLSSPEPVRAQSPSNHRRCVVFIDLPDFCCAHGAFCASLMRLPAAADILRRPLHSQASQSPGNLIDFQPIQLAHLRSEMEGPAWRGVCGLQGHACRIDPIERSSSPGRSRR